MDCQWTSLLGILPLWMRGSIDEYKDCCLQEIRLRIGMKPSLICKDKQVRLHRAIAKEDLDFCVNTASRYSPWTSQTISRGYITVSGGHRIGICGTFATERDGPNCIRDINSLCIRVARQFPGIGRGAVDIAGNILIIGRPGSGKSTLLRDIIRCKSQQGNTICVVDERQELFPCVGGVPCFECGRNTDIVSGCRKAEGIELATRVMNPHMIAVDEVTAKEDCEALIGAGWCGIDLLATAHASNMNDYLERPVYRPLVESKLFDTILILQLDKSWRAERVKYGN